MLQLSFGSKCLKVFPKYKKHLYDKNKINRYKRTKSLYIKYDFGRYFEKSKMATKRLAFGRHFEKCKMATKRLALRTFLFDSLISKNIYLGA